MRLPVNIPYHVAVRRSRLARLRYGRRLERLASRPVVAPRRLDFDVYSFSGHGELPEQVASIRSFIRSAGAPHRFVVVSDGSHRREDIELLGRLHPSVETIPLREVACPPFAPGVEAYAARHPLGKKLSLLVSLQPERPTLYVDSDVLFFAAADQLAHDRYRAPGSLFYLVDCRASLDGRLLDPPEQARRPVNSGFLVLGRQLDWSQALARLDALGGQASFFTEQTVVHLAMHDNGAAPLDSSTFVVGLADQFRFRDAYTRTGPALRHYVRPVRYRLWTNLRKAGSR